MFSDTRLLVFNCSSMTLALMYWRRPTSYRLRLSFSHISQPQNNRIANLRVTRNNASDYRLSDFAQNPLHTFHRNFPVASLLPTCWQQVVVMFWRTCYGEAATCYGIAIRIDTALAMFAVPKCHTSRTVECRLMRRRRSDYGGRQDTT